MEASPPNPQDLTPLLPSQLTEKPERTLFAPVWSGPSVSAQGASLRCLILC
jgi:hypothetical protein